MKTDEGGATCTKCGNLSFPIVFLDVVVLSSSFIFLDLIDTVYEFRRNHSAAYHVKVPVSKFHRAVGKSSLRSVFSAEFPRSPPLGSNYAAHVSRNLEPLG